MEGRWRAPLLLLAAISLTSAVTPSQFNITKTWKGESIGAERPVQISISQSPDGNFVELSVIAPFYNDASPPTSLCDVGEPCYDLWKYEVVEAFFVNDNNQYLQIQLSPWGQYLGILLNGYRQYVLPRDPLTFMTTAKIQAESSTWTGLAKIPLEYLPGQVTKFNAFATHGTPPNRAYWSLFPADHTLAEPDFHALQFYPRINLSKAVPDLPQSMSQFWVDALAGPDHFNITKTWNGQSIGAERPVQISVIESPDGKFVEVSITAPFYDDTPVPSSECANGDHCFALWRHEVVEAYFLNDDDQYFQVQLTPQNQYTAILADGSRRYIRTREFLPLTTSTSIQKAASTWTGLVKIPLEYLPSKVTKFNAFAQHTAPPNRAYWSLFPADDTLAEPDFHALKFFHHIDFSRVIPNLPQEMSQTWLDAQAAPDYFDILTTWNGQHISSEEKVQVGIDESADGKYVEVSISAPFYNDPPEPKCPAGDPCEGLWRHEVVEVYFLNDDDQYFQMQLSPTGQYNALLYNGYRGKIRKLLSLETTVNVQQKTSSWTGHAKIPMEYIPSNVTKFNTHAIHGSEPNRVFLSYFPADDTLSKPDFHVLEFFGKVDFSRVLPSLPQEASQMWLDALEGVFRYEIKTEWNSIPIDHHPAEIKLQGFEAGVEMNVTAPFFNDPKPDGPSGEPFYGLWDYEVVEMFFLNDNDEYLEVEVGPWGQHLLLLLKGARNAIKHSMPLDYIAEVPSGGSGFWKGSALIPPEYFPPNVSRMNAYAIHGTGNDRVYESLFPAPQNDPDYPQADFHRLDLFQPIDFEFLMPHNTDYSKVWLDAMASGSSGNSPVVKNEEEVEITTMLGFFNDEEEILTTLAPAVRAKPTASTTTRVRGESGSSSTRRRKPRPQKVETQDFPRGQRRKEQQSEFQNRQGLPQFFAPTPRPVPRPQRIRGTAPGRFQDRVFASDSADQNRNVNQRFPQEDPQFTDGRFPPRNPQFQESSFPPREQFFQDPERPQVVFQDQGRPQVAFQDQRRPEERPQVAFQDQGRPQVSFQDQRRPEERPQVSIQGQRRPEERPQVSFQGQRRPEERPQVSFQGQGQQFQNPRPNRDQFFQAQRPLQNQQQFDTAPLQDQGQFEERHSFQEQGQQLFLPSSELDQEPLESQQPSSNIDGSESSQGFNPPLVRQNEPVASPEVEAAIQTLSEGLAALPPPHPICFEPGLVPDPELCYAFHECVIQDGAWQMYSWRCQRGQIYDPVNVSCIRGRCPSRNTRG